MKVHVLWYDYYEDSGIVGIYTEEGKKKKIEELQQEALKFYQAIREIMEEEVARHKTMRATHLIKVNEAIQFCKDFPNSKELRKNKKQLIKRDEELLRGIKLCQRDVEKYSSPEKALEEYMKHERFIWFEREVIE